MGHAGRDKMVQTIMGMIKLMRMITMTTTMTVLKRPSLRKSIIF